MTAALMTLGDRAALAILTGFGAGLAPKAPGTFGTGVGLLIHWGATRALGGGEWLALPLAGIFFAATCLLGGAAARLFGGSKDPQSVVSDEVAGYLVSVAFTAGTPADPGFWTRAILAFVLFRAFDVAKPWPCRRLERLPGGLGIAADDIMAGIYANAGLRLALVFLAAPVGPMGL